MSGSLDNEGVVGGSAPTHFTIINMTQIIADIFLLNCSIIPCGQAGV